MENQSEKQFETLLEKSQNTLILLPESVNSDLLCAAYAFSLFLKEKNKKSTIISNDIFNKSKKLSFLPEPESIKKELSKARDFILSFNTSKNKIADVKTERSDEELRIYITPEKGAIRPQDFSFIPAKFKYDLVIVLGSPDKESLGKTFEENPDIFYEVPIINIDNHSNNEEFGQVNIVSVVSSSICEILTNKIQEVNNNKISQKIAQCLLTGIIETTESFQNKKTTPKSLQISAQLMGHGADQQEIIRHLYKTQPLHILKLWGRVMAKLQWNEESRLIWSLVGVEDFVQSRSKPEDTVFILNKIQENYSSGKVFMLLYHETESNIKGIVKSTNMELTKKISAQLNGRIMEDLCEFEITLPETNDIEKKISQIAKNIQ